MTQEMIEYQEFLEWKKMKAEVQGNGKDPVVLKVNKAVKASGVPFCKTSDVLATLEQDSYQTAKGVEKLSKAQAMEYRTGKKVKAAKRCLYSYNGIPCFVNLVNSPSEGRWVARMLRAQNVS